MQGYRKNTFVVDFGPLKTKPTINQVREYVFESLKLEVTQIKNLQLSMTKSYAYIEMSPEISAEEIATKYNKKFNFTSPDGTEHPIALFTADGALEVRVHDLPPYMSNTVIARYLAVYGEVLSMKNDVWQEHFPGVPNGTRIVRMRIKKAIPSYLNIEDETAFVRYRNQIPTCRHCTRSLHVGQKCSEVKKAIVNSVNDRLTLAQIVEGVNPTTPVPAKPTITPPNPNLTKTHSANPLEGGSYTPEFEISDTDTAGKEPEKIVVDESDTEDSEMETDAPKSKAPQVTQGTEPPEDDPALLNKIMPDTSGKRPGSPKLVDTSKVRRPSRSNTRSQK